MSFSSMLVQARHWLPSGAPLAAMHEYFRYHGVLAPGVRLLRSLSMRLKVSVVAACFAVPLAVMVALYYQASWALLLQTRQEVQGAELAEWVMHLGDAVRQEQRMVLLASLGHSTSEVTTAERQVDSAFAALANAHVAGGQAVSDAEAWNALRLRHTASRGAAGAPAPERLAALTRYSQAVTDMVTTLADASTLAVDPQPTTQYLQNAALVTLPSLVESLAQTRRSVTSFLVEDGDAVRRMLASQRLGQVADSLARARQELRVLAGHSEVLGARLGADKSWRPVREFLASAGQALSSAKAEGQPAAVLAEGDEAVKTATQLAGDALGALKALLVQREAQLTRHLHAMALLIGLLSLGGTYLLLAFYRVMEGGLVMIESQVTRMAEGDLSAPPEPLGSDEVATALSSLGGSLARLADLFAAVRQGVAAMSNASHAMSNGTGNLGQRTQRAAAAMAEIMGGVTRYIDQLEDCGKLVDQAMNVVQTLRVDALRNHQHMQRLDQGMRDLKRKSREIGEIVAVIDHIAFRTNILALNAAVEAAKAGLAGRGFAVVAQEVRSLAMRTADSARRVGIIVSASTDDIEQGSALAALTSKSMAEMDRNVARIHASMDQIVGLTRAGLQNSQDILQQIRGVDAMTGENHSLVEQMAGAAADLSAQGDRLGDKVKGFKLT